MRFVQLFTLVLLATAARADTWSFTALPQVPGSDPFSIRPSGFNNQDQVVGWFNGLHGHLYDPTSSTPFTFIDISGAQGTWPTGISNNGEIVGYCYDFAGGGGSFIKDSSGITAFPRGPACPNVCLKPTGVNSTGEIVGNGGFDPSYKGGFLWDPFSATPLATINFPGALSTVAVAINDAGQVVGNSDRGAFLYSNGIYTPIDYPDPSVGVRVLGINNLGEITGLLGRSGEPDVPFVMASSGFHIIEPDILSYNFSFGPNVPVGINDQGQIVGYDSSVGLAFIGSPSGLPTGVPEPATIMLFSTALCLLVWRGRSFLLQRHMRKRS